MHGTCMLTKKALLPTHRVYTHAHAREHAHEYPRTSTCACLVSVHNTALHLCIFSDIRTSSWLSKRCFTRVSSIPTSPNSFSITATFKPMCDPLVTRAGLAFTLKASGRVCTMITVEDAVKECSFSCSEEPCEHCYGYFGCTLCRAISAVCVSCTRV